MLLHRFPDVASWKASRNVQTCEHIIWADDMPIAIRWSELRDTKSINQTVVTKVAVELTKRAIRDGFVR